MTCYCEHDQASHHKKTGKCNKPGCDCETFDKAPHEDDEPGQWLPEAVYS